MEAAKPKVREPLVSNPRLYVGKIFIARIIYNFVYYLKGRLNPTMVEKQDVYKAFEAYGRIVDFNFQRDFAFVEYDSLESASNALHEMNGAQVITPIINISIYPFLYCKDKRSEDLSRRVQVKEYAWAEFFRWWCATFTVQQQQPFKRLAFFLWTRNTGTNSSRSGPFEW